MFANFSWFWKCKFQTVLSLLVQKDIDKNVQHSLNIGVCTSFHFLLPSSFHHSSSVIFLIYLHDVKRVISSDHSSCSYHPFTHRIINLFIFSHVQCVMSYLFSQQQMTVGDPSRLFILCLPILLMCDIFAIHFITHWK